MEGSDAPLKIKQEHVLSVAAAKAETRQSGALPEIIFRGPLKFFLGW